jgi:hypothetical protein
MSEATPNLYAGLDQMVAKPTKTESVAVPAQALSEEARKEAIVPGHGNGQAKEEKKTAVLLEPDGNLVRQLEPDLPDALDLYRKQTINFGPEDLESVHKMQQALRDEHDQEISKQDIVRAAIELLVKDFDLHKEDSFLMRKFVRR